MIKSVTIVNPKSETLVMELANPWESGIAIQNIEGLGPGKVTVNTSEYATIDGSYFQSTRMPQRNIVFTLKPMALPSVEESRLKIYQFFPIKKLITMLFKTDQRTAQIEGIVESNEPTIFSENEITQISIICYDPYFYELGDTQTVFSGVQPLFEFPFENASLTSKELIFGQFRLDTRVNFLYEGDMDTGFVITIHAVGTADGITIYNTDTQESIEINTSKITSLTGQMFDAGDDIIISTKPGNKYARLLRDGFYTNIIGCINKDADWFKLTKGWNSFAFTADTGENNIMMTFSYRNAYGGI